MVSWKRCLTSNIHYMHISQRIQNWWIHQTIDHFVNTQISSSMQHIDKTSSVVTIAPCQQNFSNILKPTTTSLTRWIHIHPMHMSNRTQKQWIHICVQKTTIKRLVNKSKGFVFHSTHTHDEFTYPNITQCICPMEHEIDGLILAYKAPLLLQSVSKPINFVFHETHAHNELTYEHKIQVNFTRACLCHGNTKLVDSHMTHTHNSTNFVFHTTYIKKDRIWLQTSL